MASIGQIINSESGSSVRTKLNQTITEANKVDSKLSSVEDDTTPKLGGILDTNLKRVLLSQGADIASANNLTLGADGNVFNITGTTQINLIESLNFRDGSIIYLKFNDILTIKHNYTDSGSLKGILFTNGSDLTTVSGQILGFVLNDGKWNNIFNSSGTGGGGTTNDKGWFVDETALNTAYPTGSDGWYATVGTTDTIWVWDSDTSAWVDSGSSYSGFAAETHAAAAKTTPVDADELGIVDSAASWIIKKLTWANLKATLKTYFDIIYQAIGNYLTTDTANEISAITEKTAPVDNDLFIIEDSEDSYNKKKVKKANVGGSSGGASKWTALTATTDFSTTAASTSTITMNTDQTGSIYPGMPIKYVLSGTTYYGIVTAITSTLMTIAGVALTTGAGDLTALSYSNFLNAVYVEEVLINGSFANKTSLKMIEDYLLLKGGIYWKKSKAFCVQMSIICTDLDSGTVTTEAQLNARINNLNLLSADLTVNTTLVNSVVTINSTNYDINFGEKIDVELAAKASGTSPNNDAKNLTVYLIFVMP